MWWKRLLHKDLTIAAAALILSATLAYYSASGVFSSNDRLGGRDERSIMTMASTTNDASTSCSSCSVRLYQGLSPSTGHVESEINRMRATVATPHGCNAEIEHVILNTHEQRSFLEKHGMECFVEKDRSDGGIPGKNNPALEKYDELVNIGMQYMAHELWKYCALSSTPDATNNNKETYVAYLDAESPLLSIFSDIFLQPSPKRRNYAVIGSNALFSGTVHGSFLFLTPSHTSLARTVVRLMIETDSTILDTSPLLIPKTLHALIESNLEGVENTDNNDDGLTPGVYSAATNGEEWVLLGQRCHGNVFTQGDSGSKMRGEDGSMSLERYRMTYHCPPQSGFCCEIYDPNLASIVFLTKHPLLPNQLLPPESMLSRPYLLDKNNDSSGNNYDEVVYNESSLPFISTIREEVYPRPDGHISTPNFFDTLHANDCLPTSKTCKKCLHQSSGANCNTCKSQCKCYCENLCKLKVEEKHTSKRVYITPPAYSKDPSRLVPRIVHQTWFEPVNMEKYPNMSRLIESWKQSGWEYRFYSDEASASFIETHFPPEVLEAYNSITPGAFKADLFRYCTLLINGGVYADMDVLLEANLDAVISADAGFIVPVDQPGIEANHRICLWNGLIAVAPGHPFLAKVIEVVVNNIRNRFTSVDYDNLLCPEPELSVLHRYDMLFTAGPCILGYAINEILGNRPHKPFEAGEIDVDRALRSIPGRTIILNQGKKDMGAHRFTWLEKNLIFAATDLPDYDDRKQLHGDEKEKHGHYSDLHRTQQIYGQEGLYTDKITADEKIHFVVRDQVVGSKSLL